MYVTTNAPVKVQSESHACVKAYNHVDVDVVVVFSFLFLVAFCFPGFPLVGQEGRDREARRGEGMGKRGLGSGRASLRVDLLLSESMHCEQSDSVCVCVDRAIVCSGGLAVLIGRRWIVDMYFRLRLVGGGNV